jgi:PRC-barrel domain
MTRCVCHAGSCLRNSAILLVLWTLSACHSAPVADRSRKPEPAAPETYEYRVDAPIETPIVAPPCLPVEAAPKPIHTPAPKPEPPAPAAPASGVTEPVASPRPIDAEVRALDNSIVSVLGKKVQGANGEDLGRVVDVLADAGGRVRVAVIEFGGFLGVGIRRVAVDWSLLRFPAGGQDKSLTLSVSGKKLQSAPEYKNSTHPQALMAPQTPAVAPTPSSAEGKK